MIIKEKLSNIKRVPRSLPNNTLKHCTMKPLILILTLCLIAVFSQAATPLLTLSQLQTQPQPNESFRVNQTKSQVTKFSFFTFTDVSESKIEYPLLWIFKIIYFYLQSFVTNNVCIGCYWRNIDRPENMKGYLDFDFELKHFADLVTVCEIWGCSVVYAFCRTLLVPASTRWPSKPAAVLPLTPEIRLVFHLVMLMAIRFLLYYDYIKWN